MKKKIISLHGSYFGNNYGDILLVNMFAQWIKEIYPESTINLPFANRSKTLDLPEGTKGIRNLIRSRCLVFCGGGYFGEQPRNKKRWARRNFVRHGIIGILAILFRIPYAIIGVEFGPISVGWFRRICLIIARNAKCLVVRNAESKEYLERFGIKNVKLSADAVLSLSEEVPVDESRQSSEILLHIPGIRSNKSQIEELVSQLANYIISNGRKFSIGLINDGFSDIYNSNDYKPVLDILKSYGILYKIYPYKGFKCLIRTINASSFVITTKLHVGITAAALNVRPLSIWLHPKTNRLHSQIDNSDYCISIQDTNSFRGAFDSYFHQESEYFLPYIIKQQAMKNKYILHAFLKSFVL